ncbi:MULTISPECIES: hypothetical protein [Corynebacterium]|uniref:Uncharacterized protein n=2 Tax=Corynebacterium TaxID=1716 RepID=A0ABD4TRE5_9CORY|nr:MULTISPECIES: hypothetical protein [Corynebacterium]MCO6393735.1 hypothetical protein [Corynebacterium lipophilum]MCQ4614054.1 hypothetical protein [Corynebacterium pseudogenitalium]MCZ2116370.1 hypothetical protein [Corynebacterium lipophilum]MDK8243392.1 hypothetical protein [Corynebacterium sp. UMB10321]OIR44473.1 hypothetical protein BJP06_02310 [Corynebacterium sp. NML120713]
MTYYPAPGHQHVQLLVPSPKRSGRAAETRRRQARYSPSDPRRTGSNVAPLVRTALAASFGATNLRALRADRFSTAARTNVRAYRRFQQQHAGPPRIVTCHARDGGEFFGTVATGQKRFGFVAKMDNGRLVSFKIL